MKKSTLVMLGSGVLIAGLCASMALVPSLRPRVVVDRLGTAFPSITCDEQRCPPDAEWVYPVPDPITSGFRTEARPTHNGVDMAAARGTPVVAASAGVVTISKCQASHNGRSYGCDQDGSPEVLGCGWFVKVLHADRIATLYCHLDQQPEVSVGDAVTTGQLLGYVGSTGNSSEPHLHFEVQVGRRFVPPVSATAVDPEQFLAERVAPEL